MKLLIKRAINYCLLVLLSAPPAEARAIFRASLRVTMTLQRAARASADRALPPYADRARRSMAAAVGRALCAIISGRASASTEGIIRMAMYALEPDEYTLHGFFSAET
jgi:hypothetical protein